MESLILKAENGKHQHSQVLQLIMKTSAEIMRTPTLRKGEVAQVGLNFASF